MAYGDIAGLIDSYAFAAFCYTPNISHVDGNVYAIAYYQPIANQGILITLTVNPDGTIPPAIIDTHIFYAGILTEPTITKVGANVFVIAYMPAIGPFRGRLDTIQIADDGTIGAAIDTLDIFVAGITWWTRRTNPINVSGDVWIFATQENGALELRTISISPAGNIGAPISQTTMVVLGNMEFSVAHVQDNLYAVIVYGNNPLQNATVRTFTISDAGVISAEIASLVLEVSGYIQKPQLSHIAGNVWGAFYTAPPGAGVGRVRTFTINDDGTFGGLIDVFDFEANPSWVSAPIQRTDTNLFTFFYSAPSWIEIHTLTIQDDGTIGAITSTLVIPTIAGQAENNIFKGDDVYIISAFAYPMGPGLGIIGTFGVSTKLPVVSTLPASDIVVPGIGVSGQATLNGQLDYDAGEICACGFEWGATPPLGTTTTTQGQNAGDSFSEAITGLAPGTYYFRAFAETDWIKVYGSTLSFKVESLKPSVATLPATGVT